MRRSLCSHYFNLVTYVAGMDFPLPIKDVKEICLSCNCCPTDSHVWEMTFNGHVYLQLDAHGLYRC